MSKHVKKHSTRRSRLLKRRHLRVRKRVFGTAEKPRLAVFRSTRHIYAQVIDDTGGKTLASASTLSPDIRDRLEEGDKRFAAKLVGEHIAKLCKERDIQQIVFDRGGFLYTGARVRALAEGARKGGLKF